MSLPSLIVFKPNAPLDFLVAQYLSGVPAKMAIEEAGANCTERNIQKMAKSCGRVRMGAVPAAEEPALPPPPKLLKRKSTNLHVDQVEKLAADKHKLNRAHIDARKRASLELKASQEAREKTGGRRGGNRSAEEIVKDVNSKLPSDVKPVAETSVKRDVREGRAGESPLKRGPNSKVPKALINATHTWVSVSQQKALPKPSDVKRTMRAAVSGTEHAGLSSRQCMEQLKKHKVGEVATAKVHTQEERRWLWMAYDNINDWFGFWKDMLLEYYFATDVPDPVSGSSVTLAKGARGRFINADESKRVFSNEGDKGGSRAKAFFNPLYPTGGRRIVQSSIHTTELHGTTDLGEVIPPFFMGGE